MSEESLPPSLTEVNEPQLAHPNRRRTAWIIGGVVTVTAVAAAAIALVVLSGGGSNAQPTQPQKVDRFVRLVRADTSRIIGSSSKAGLVRLGKQVCAVFKEGDGFGTADGILRGSGGATPFQSWLFIGLAVTVFCPKFKDQVPAKSPTPP